MSTTTTPSTLREGWSVIGRGIRGQPRWFGLAVVGSVVYGIMTSLTAAAIGYVVDRAVTPAIAARSVTAGQLWFIGGVMSAVVLTTIIGVIGRRLAGGVAMFNLGAMYRRQVTRQYLRLPLSWHHRHPSGQLLSNANADVEATWNIFGPLPMALGVVVMLVFGVLQMVIVDPWLAVVGLTVFPMLFVANVAFQRAMSPRVTRAQQLRADVSEVAHESFEAALIVKSLGREDHEAERFRVVTHQLRDANIEVGRTRGRFDPAIEAIPDHRHPGRAARGHACAFAAACSRRPRWCRSPTSSPSSPSRSGLSGGSSPSCLGPSWAGSASRPCSRPKAAWSTGSSWSADRKPPATCRPSRSRTPMTSRPGKVTSTSTRRWSTSAST